MGWSTGFEPATARSTIWGSNQAELRPPFTGTKLSLAANAVKLAFPGFKVGSGRNPNPDKAKPMMTEGPRGPFSRTHGNSISIAFESFRNGNGVVIRLPVYQFVVGINSGASGQFFDGDFKLGLRLSNAPFFQE